MEARSTSREENARLEKYEEKDRLIRSAWGVVKRAMHPWDLATGPRKGALGGDSSPGSPNENVGARSRSVVGRSWSHASLVDDLLRSS